MQPPLDHSVDPGAAEAVTQLVGPVLSFELSPIPFPASTAQPPELRSASVTSASLKLEFHPSFRACLFASCMWSFSITFVCLLREDDVGC